MPISLEKAAYLIGTSEKMLLRWARQGTVPSIERNGKHQFEKRILLAWAKRRGISLRLDSPEETEDNTPYHAELSSAMANGGCLFDVEGSDVESVFCSAVERLALPENVEPSDLVERLLEREALASTGIGNGIAIPHPRQPLKRSPNGGLICTCFLKEEVDFAAVDGSPVTIMFLMLSPNTKIHLQLLARLSFFLHQPKFLTMLSSCRDEDSFLGQVSEMERTLESSGLPKGV